MRPGPCAVGVAEHAGWANLVFVAAPAGVPTVVARQRIELVDAGLPTQPYHHETLTLGERDADALVARVRRAVEARTVAALRDALAGVAAAHTVTDLAIRQPPFPDLPASIAAVRASYPLQCAADGMLYQRAVCSAARALGLAVHECARGHELATAAAHLRTEVAAVTAFASDAGRPAGPPWTQEHRLAFAMGMAALAVRCRGRALRLVAAPPPARRRR